VLYPSRLALPEIGRHLPTNCICPEEVRTMSGADLCRPQAMDNMNPKSF
jgi:hypothetical protein